MGNHVGVVGGGRLDEQIKVAALLAPVSKTATFTPDGVDRKGYNAAIFIVDATLAGDGSFTPAIADGTTAAGCTATAAAKLGLSDTPVAITATGQSVIFADLRKMSQFVSLVMTAADTPTFTLSMDVILGAATDILPAA